MTASAPARDLRADELRLALAGREAPFAVVDLDAWDANAQDLLRRAGRLPVRLATKSVRCRALVERALSRGFSGVLTYSLDEALWLADQGVDDLLVAYPPVGLDSLSRLATHPRRDTVTVMIDHPDHVTRLAAVVREASAGPIRVCLDLDASLRIGPVHLGVRRSCLRTPEAAAAAARAVLARPELRLVGVMSYDAQVAGLQDSSPAVRLVKAASVRELLGRRAAVVTAVEDVLGHPLELVNGGGTGSLHLFADGPGHHRAGGRLRTDVTAYSTATTPSATGPRRGSCSRWCDDPRGAWRRASPGAMPPAARRDATGCRARCRHTASRCSGPRAPGRSRRA
ncbi:alanine racemase [Arsenicicoccus bolidensis]|uniref:alanine racemase n=1 Tax=Arsenicicoccus bolidensis TaxID=229480 RepID=UPI0027DF3756|nr:alanine racemase [Arsenicicoccus bolidensis]